MSRSFRNGAIVVAVFLILVVIGLVLFTTRITAGHVGIVYSANGGLKDKTLPQGIHIIMPWEKVTEYPISTETVSYADVMIGTKDGKPIKTTLQYNYHIEISEISAIFNKFRGAKSATIENGFLKTRLTEMAKEVTTKYSVLDIMGEKSGDVSIKIQEKFHNDVKGIGFVIESVTFTPPMPDEQTQKAIQAKVDAQQLLEQYKTEKEQAQVLADKARIEAEGRADAVLIEAEGLAKANRVKAQSITDKLIEYDKIHNWNGQLPTATSDAGIFNMTLPSQQTSK